MGRPRFHSVRHFVTAMLAAGTLVLAMTTSAAALRPWQNAWGSYDRNNQWHDAGWWLKNRPHWVIVHHPEWMDNYADTYGRIGDSDRLHAWHYGDGSFDRESTIDERPGESPKSA